MKRRTKIVCTIGPAVATPEKISQLIHAGMDVARLNCSHGDWESKNEWVELIRNEAQKCGRHVALLADLQGPKFRIGDIVGSSRILVNGEILTVGPSPETEIPIPSDVIYNAMSVGTKVLLGDGEVELRLMSLHGAHFEAKVMSGGLITSRKGITLVGKSFDAPALSEKDREDVYQAAKTGVDFIALSYVKQASDIRELRRLVDQYDPTIRLCAKIETPEALKDIDEIIRAVDLIMVARGDLGLQINMEEVPFAQKHIIRRCALAGKPVITATQMLESMLNAPRPTRAEATDIANAVLDGTDALMLSGETAAGKFPIEAVRTMARIAETAERSFDYVGRLESLPPTAAAGDIETQAVAKAAVQLATSLKAKAIVTTSTSGLTPRMVSRYRPTCPILCASWNPRTQAFLACQWGVDAVAIDLPKSTDDVIHCAIDAFMREKKLKLGDLVVVTAGVPAGKPGNTNLIFVETVK
ncbi:MAG: pyruvate kinase [Armatimonadetes bacterium]|nr:pyruvate kinase [Armatimonadota bacterium]